MQIMCGTRFLAPKDVVRLAVKMIFANDDELLSSDNGDVRTLYDKIIAELIQAYGKRNPSKPYKIRASRDFCIVRQRIIG